MAYDLARKARWKASPIYRKMQETMEEARRIIDAHYANPTPETLAGLIRLSERSLEQAAIAETQADNLRRMVADLETNIETLREKGILAQKVGDSEMAAKVRGDRKQYELSLQGTRTQQESARETREQVGVAVKRWQERVEREKARVAALFPPEEDGRQDAGGTEKAGRPAL